MALVDYDSDSSDESPALVAPPSQAAPQLHATAAPARAASTVQHASSSSAALAAPSNPAAVSSGGRMKAFEEMPEVSKAARLAANRLFARQVQSTTSGAASSSSMVVDLDDGHAAVESVTGKRRAEDDGSTYAASTAGHPYAAVTDAHGNAAAASAESGFPTDGYGAPLAGRQPQAGYPYSYPQYAYPPYGYPAAAAGYGYPGYEQTAAGGSGTGAMGYGQIAGASGQGSGSNTGNVTVIDRNAARHLDKKMRRELGITEDGEYSAEYASAIGSEVGGSNVKQLSAHQMYGDWQPPVAVPGASSGPQHQGSKSKPAVQAKVWDASAGAAQTTLEASRTHKTKHQIQTVAASALAAQASVAEQKLGMVKTKAQTWAKYGW